MKLNTILDDYEKLFHHIDNTRLWHCDEYFLQSIYLRIDIK